MAVRTIALSRTTHALSLTPPGMETHLFEASKADMFAAAARFATPSVASACRSDT